MGEAPLRIMVNGVPQPQGSKSPVSHCYQTAALCTRCRHRHLVKINTKEAVKGLDPWRRQVAAVARVHMRGGCPIGGPVVVALTFTFPRPKSHYRTGKSTSHLLTAAAPTHHTGKPDTDKLARAIMDGLTLGGVWYDDSQVDDIIRSKKLWAPSAYTAPGTFALDVDPYLLAGSPDADRMPGPGVIIRVTRPRDWEPSPEVAGVQETLA